MFRSSATLFAAILVVLVLAIPAVARAQGGLVTSSSIITGVVRDSSAAAIPGVTVRIVNEATGVAVEAISNAEGAYQAPALPAGPSCVVMSSALAQ